MTGPIEHDPRWLLVQRIVASSGFVNSNRLSTFLLYVTRQSLAGEGANLNERSIGEAVFQRSPDYDPRDDNIVRSHASRLRIRLEGFFEVEGASEELRVTIPREAMSPNSNRSNAVRWSQQLEFFHRNLRFQSQIHTCPFRPPGLGSELRRPWRFAL